MTTTDDLAGLDPADLSPAVRGRVRAIATSDPDPDRRALARRILDHDAVPPSTAYTRGADRAAAYDQTQGGGVRFDPRRPDNVDPRS